ncbi:winged helix-turn-helix transcriptional regulator [Streptomyces sp. NPDC057521]|uniref:winged helix-turn-helix transcriptional regulator n=1 Tax=Streptomyces sp. NPDC057521 TaxID=3346156 RepID=UPI0036D09A0D
MFTNPLALPQAQQIENSLSHLAPRWTVWVSQTLAQHDRPLRVGEIAEQLPFISLTSICARLPEMHAADLISRTSSRYGAPYKLSALGESLPPVYRALSDWSQEHLSLDEIAGAERIEDAVRRLYLRHTTAVIQALSTHGPMRIINIAEVTDLERKNTLQRLKRLQRDGLVTRTGPRRGDPYVLTEAGQALGPVYAAVEQWAVPSTEQISPPSPAPAAQARVGLSLETSTARTAAALRRSPAAPASLFSHAPQPQPQPRVPTAVPAQTAPIRSR